jgi:hypothetical protein
MTTTGQVGAAFGDVGERGEAAHVRHAQVQQHEVEVGVRRDRVERLAVAGGLVDHRGASLGKLRQDRPHALPDEGVVVDHEDLDVGHATSPSGCPDLAAVRAR